jgi:excisionase family DNA binding protein
MLRTMKEAAEALGVSYRSVRRWVREGRIPAHRLGPRTVRIADEDLQHFIDASRDPEGARS